MQLQEQNLIQLLKAAIIPGYSPELQEVDFPAIFALADKHAITSLLYPPLKKVLPISDPFLSDMKKRSFSAATRESMQSKELSGIFAACEKAQIPILPLKGCVIKHLYPYPELRFMSDADLLIPREEERNMKALLQDMGFRFHKVDTADTDVYISPVGMTYEIHKCLKEEGFHEPSKEFADKLLELSHAQPSFTYVRQLPPEEHYIYILCHFIKHFIYGGIGIRQLTDLYVYQRNQEMDPQKLCVLLEKLGLQQFHDSLQTLWTFWFENGTGGDLTLQLADYILSSGVFGSEAHRATDRFLANGQGRKYFLHRLFPPYRTMSGYFPVLKKAPILLPFLWIWRILRALLFRRSKLKYELHSVGHTEAQLIQERRNFYYSCGLSVYEESQ